ncbi:MAG: DUF362 domain-containing protein [Bacteroidales bacterium]|nr:DUF362 domain-containing protein [Bacteroidales bacterium]
MNKNFLHIIKIPEYYNYKNCGYNELKDYYKSDKLINDISLLINKWLPEEEICNKKVLIKPNWVKHSTRQSDEYVLRTNDNFLLAVLNAIIEMKPAEIIIGDAPIQGCIWENMLSKGFLDEINNIVRRKNIPVQIKDFRRRKYIVSENKPQVDIMPLSDYVIFNLGRNSYLEAITSKGKTRFRVTNYDSAKMTFAHSPGVNKYCIAKDFFNADTVISLPKIKTHQKTGITGALKNLVGINGDKDFLPHHRLGGTKKGGDCYPGGSELRYLSELALDKANRNQGQKSFWLWQKLSSLLWRLSFPGPEHQISAGWYGNDTTWRMVLDLNRIAEFGRPDGTIAEEKQRQIYSMCDAIIAGQGDGPLDPQPLPLGIISFTNNSVINDRAMAVLMGLPTEKIPILNRTGSNEDICDITLNGKKIQLNDLKPYARKATPPRGWINYFKETK